MVGAVLSLILNWTGTSSGEPLKALLSELSANEGLRVVDKKAGSEKDFSFSIVSITSLGTPVPR